MLIDAADLWVRGRKMTPHSVKMFRSLVFVAVLGALAGSLLGGNSLVVLFLAPAMIIYLFITRKRPGRLLRRGRRQRARRLRRRAHRERVSRPSPGSARAARSTAEPNGPAVTPA